MNIATVLAKTEFNIISNDQSIRNVRDLLDSNSQVNLITLSCVKPSNISYQMSTAQISGFGGFQNIYPSNSLYETWY